MNKSPTCHEGGTSVNSHSGQGMPCTNCFRPRLWPVLEPAPGWEGIGWLATPWSREAPQSLLLGRGRAAVGAGEASLTMPATRAAGGCSEASDGSLPSDHVWLRVFKSLYLNSFVCSLGSSYPTTNTGTMLHKYLTQCILLTQPFRLLAEE